MDTFCHLCIVFDFVVLSCLFLAALWLPAGKGQGPLTRTHLKFTNL